MIQHKDRYLKFLERRGVGSNDRVASSPDSYLAYLNGVSALTGADITPLTVRSEDDVRAILAEVRGMRAEKTLSNYRSALRQYVAMVEDEGL